MLNKDISRSIEACAAHYGDQAEAMRAYLLEGQVKALALNNRGPIRFTQDGHLHPDIRQAYSEYGFYVFESVLTQEEIDEIEADINIMREHFPVQLGAKVDKQGRKAWGADSPGPPRFISAKPLTDPFGGTPLANGRHQVKLFEPQIEKESDAESVFIVLGSLEFSEACLRTYAHPQLLKVAAAINGEDFAPFHECLFIKEPMLGAAVSWHQDGDTHWDNPEFDEDIHGFNFMAQVYGSTAVNGVWAVPGSHKLGRVDITQWVKESGSERLSNAVPMLSNPGDVIISNRQLVHGSFANTGFEPRLTANFGFHKRSSVLNVKGAGIHNDAAVYDEAFINRRSEALGYAIAARKVRFPDEEPYVYKPLMVSGKNFDGSVKKNDALKNYNAYDLSI